MIAREENSEPVPSLSTEDAAAIDALFASRLVSESVGSPESPERARARAALGVLNMLDCSTRSDHSLTDVAFHRVLQFRRSAEGTLEPELSEDDRSALDAYVMEGFDPERAPASLRERARRHHALASLATRAPVMASPDLLDRTIQRIESEIAAERQNLNLETVRARRGIGIRLADVVSVAAVLLIGAGVLLPVMDAVRDQSRRTLCNNNLANAAMAMTAYAGSNRDALPVSYASLGSGKWWDVGKDHSNSANLYTLARTGYSTLSVLACPGNPRAVTGDAPEGSRDWECLEEVSYSYQIMYGRERPLWNGGPRTVVLADRSPVVPRSVRGEQFDPMANARSHGSRGQHLLYNDGSAEWARSPMLENGDNIWLPRAIEIRVDLVAGRPIRPLNGTEMPDAADDACLGP